MAELKPVNETSQAAQRVCAPFRNTCHHRKLRHDCRIRPVFDYQHTRVSQGVAPPYHQGRKSRAQSCHPLTAHGMWARLMTLCDWLCPLHCLPAQPKPAVRRLATWDRLKKRHGVEVTYFLRLFCRAFSTRVVALSARRKSTASGLLMMAFASHQYALEMNSGSAASSLLSYWAAVVPRGSHV
jgi:hypothetical protein